MRFKNDSQTSRTRALLPPLAMPCPIDRLRSLRPLPLSCMMSKPAGLEADGPAKPLASRRISFWQHGREPAPHIHATLFGPTEMEPGQKSRLHWQQAHLACSTALPPLEGKPYASAFTRAMTLSRIAARCSSEGIQFSEIVSRTSKPTEDISEAICFCASGAQP